MRQNGNQMLNTSTNSHRTILKLQPMLNMPFKIQKKCMVNVEYKCIEITKYPHSFEAFGNYNFGLEYIFHLNVLVPMNTKKTLT